ncbi:MAG TPA: threonine/serine exporter family protein [Chthoniobacter sp.]|nr:threonine/serine exporter family protein [Chthoniobacter sp.]
MNQNENDRLPPLESVARLSLSAGRLLLETGASGRMVHEAIQDIGLALKCDPTEVMCQHAAVLVMIRRGSLSCMQMTKVGEHGVNFRRAQAVRQVISDLMAEKVDYVKAQTQIERIPVATAAYPVWFVCICTGLACSAFSRLLGADWASFVPILIASTSGQWLRHKLAQNRHNIFVITALVSFVSAMLAGVGTRLCGSTHFSVAMISSTLLLVPGVAILNTQTDVLESKPNLAMARALRILYILVFMCLGLALAQALVIAKL